MTTHALADEARCACGSGDEYGSCCGPLHAGRRAAATAVQLMRSRYTAFVVGDVGYLRRTWHPRTRPGALELGSAIRWLRLDILDTVAGGPFDNRGEVEFRAIHRDGDGRHVLHERSRFVRENRRWSYVDGDIRS
ncbi:YchJ family protein [Pseudoclavibacter chungangensis]|uniref:UPF0225 protein F8O01_12490 n=1 Tax=Pseudoclavibacter chungangensis TaxID=587635 RepID=A0A7J5BRK5_9MICO|nr:YchJ family protein [Pseudoclavibacter chungangensis]KAB1655077.1 YchJ family protein [Pseudoclavibacter chungangensis]NYJ66159.1 SEC-C motif-containing protein [Pseudoclavibacter chungangensis]